MLSNVHHQPGSPSKLQQKKLQIPARSVLWFLIGLVLLLTCLSTVLAFSFFNLPFNSRAIEVLFTMFNLDQEYNIPTFVSSLFLAGTSILLAYIFLEQRLKRNRYQHYWAILSGIFLLLSMDEYMSGHERLIAPLRDSLNTSGILHFAWVIPGGILVILTGLLFLRFFLSLSTQNRRRFLLAATLYIGGALGMELVGGYVITRFGENNFLYASVTNGEEMLEMLGISYFIYALLCYIEQQHVRLRTSSYTKIPVRAANPLNRPSAQNPRTSKKKKPVPKKSS